jgi:hypothetical protein
MSETTEIWYLIGALPVGGTEKTLVNLVNNLDREAFDVELFTIIERRRRPDGRVGSL